MTCIICESALVEDDHWIDIEGHGVEVCAGCALKVEETDYVTGRWHIKACPTCGHVEYLTFAPYKKRGRPAGSKSDPIKKAERMGVKSLEAF